MPDLDDALAEVGQEESLPMRAAMARTRARLFDADVPPARIDRYALLGVLGRGASGVVHRAHDPVLKRDVALKVYPKQTDPGVVRRIKREARISNLADIAKQQQRFEDAAQAQTRVVELSKRFDPSSKSTADALEALGEIRGLQGRSDDAERLSEEASAIRDATGP